ncbi:MAG: site-2 protease family protein [bacterium]
MNISLMLAQFAIIIPSFLIALSFHEFSHALTATVLGDNTPKRMGRLTLNPLAHIDFLGLLFLIVFKIGWAKPVVFNNNNFKHPRLYTILTALAGPLSNFILALACFYVLAYFPVTIFPPALSLAFRQIFEAIAWVNIMLGVFNALPIPPLDGSHVLTALLIRRFPSVIMWFYRYSLFILIALFLLPQTRTILLAMIVVTESLIKTLVF